MYAASSQSFTKEFSVFLNENITIETMGGEKISGVLIAYDPTTLSLVLDKAVVGSEGFKRLMINGSHVAKIYLREKKVDLERLKEMLEKSFPNLVEYKKELGVILVMNRIRVTEEGVEGDSGPASERVKKIYERFMEETRSR
jgi:small nuclear ribonucleoprotein (snRNP)-like protein